MNNSFVNVIEKFSKLNLPTLHYSGGDFAKWQEIFQLKLQALRGRKIERVKMQASLAEKEDCQTHFRQKVVIHATEVSHATGYLLTPKTDKKNLPAIIASPGHYTFGKDTIAGDKSAQSELEKDPNTAYGKKAVEAGYVVFVPDWWGWGDKSTHLPLTQGREQCDTIQMAASMYGFSVLNLHLLEADAIVDFLQSLEMVSPDRIGIIGNSYGGRTAMWIAAFNPNIRCTVSAGAMNLFVERASKLASCAIQYFSGLLEYGDVPEVYSLIAPRPLQLQAGSHDSLINQKDRGQIAKTVTQAYKSYNKTENLSIEVFQGGHYLNWDLAHEFLQKKL